MNQPTTGKPKKKKKKFKNEITVILMNYSTQLRSIKYTYI